MTDLDELLEKIRNSTSKEYFLEATNAYRSGANKASIVSLWITVLFDIIEKIRELAEKGDNNAIKYVNELDLAIENSNIEQLTKIERNLLKNAYEEFEFFNKEEYDLLNRLKEDRNLCAHPAFTTKKGLFQPSSELVRSHLVHSVLFLLSQKPVQGKKAIDEFIEDIKSKSFPEDLDRTYEFLNEKYLKRAKSVMVRNLVKILAKNIINLKIPGLAGNKYRIINSLIVIAKTHPEVYNTEIKHFLNQIIENVKDNDLLNVLWLLEADEKGWKWLDKSAKIRIKSLLEKKLESTPSALEIYHLLEKHKIGELDDVRKKVLNEISEMIFKNIFEYKLASSYRAVEEIGEEKILPYAMFFNERHVNKVIHAFISNKNEQILDANGSPDLWNQLFDEIQSNIKKESIKDWLELKDFISQKKRVKSFEILIKKISELEFIYKN